jgi:hypothetical protein
MRSVPAIALASLLLILSGCPDPGGTLITDDDDDDDDDDNDVTGDDDDDATGDDDDDDATGDDDTGDDDTGDDDDTSPGGCSEIGESGFFFDAGAAGGDGMILEGELGWDGSILSVTPLGGPSLGLPIQAAPGTDLDALMDGIDGPGRFFMVSLASGAWVNYGVMAAFTANGDHAVILGNSGFPGLAWDFFGFYLSVDPQPFACPDGVVDVSGCGMGAALPLEVTFPGEESPASGVWPGESAELGEFLFRQYHGYQIHEPLCDDFDERGVSWSMVKE